eukprot:4932953-Pleurochrysis_carterae.AAC.1
MPNLVKSMRRDQSSGRRRTRFGAGGGRAEGARIAQAPRARPLLMASSAVGYEKRSPVKQVDHVSGCKSVAISSLEPLPKEG